MKLKITAEETLITLIFIILYILIGNARSVQENPFIPGATIAFNMIIPVVAGAVGGRYVGAYVGFFGTLLESLTPAGSIYTMLAIVPHTMMGYTAGVLKKTQHIHVVILALVLGHILNLILFTVFNQIPIGIFTNISFWMGLGYEIILGSIGIIIIYYIYKIGFIKNGALDK